MFRPTVSEESFVDVNGVQMTSEEYEDYQVDQYYRRRFGRDDVDYAWRDSMRANGNDWKLECLYAD